MPRNLTSEVLHVKSSVSEQVTPEALLNLHSPCVGCLLASHILFPVPGTLLFPSLLCLVNLVVPDPCLLWDVFPDCSTKVTSTPYKGSSTAES